MSLAAEVSASAAAVQTTAPLLSALVVAHDEEAQLPDCLSCLGFADEIVVVLDRCTDRSREIALQFTDRIVEGAWEREGPRRHAGIAPWRSRSGSPIASSKAPGSGKGRGVTPGSGSAAASGSSRSTPTSASRLSSHPKSRGS